MEAVYTISLIVTGLVGGAFLMRDARGKVEKMRGAAPLFNREKIFLPLLFFVMILGDLAACYYADGIWNGIKVVGALSVAAAAAWTDGNCKVIPNSYSVLLLGIRTLLLIPEGVMAVEQLPERIIGSVVSLVICLAFLLLMRKITGGGLGYGDVKFLSALSFLCGIYAAIGTMLIALLICVVCSGVLIARKKKTWKDTLPFGPFLFIGLWVTVILGFF